MKIQNKKTKIVTMLASMMIGLIILSPMTVLPNVSAQQNNVNTEILNHAPPVGPIKGMTIVLPALNSTQEQKVIPIGPVRQAGVSSISDHKLCAAPFGTRSDKVVCSVVPGYSAGSTWAEGPVFYPQGSGYSSYSGIGASPQTVSIGSTSFSTPVTREVVSLNLIANGHHWGLQNAIGWGNNSLCGSNGYEESLWLYDITGNAYYAAYGCITSSIVGHQYNLQIYYNTSTSQWNFVAADGNTYSITAIAGAPSSDITAVDGITTAANEGQFPILLESADTTSTDFNSFEIDMYGSEIRSGSSWVLAGSGSTVNIPAYSYYSNYVQASSNTHLAGADLVGGTLAAPTTVGYEGHTENSIYGPGINISKSGYDNYWVCPVSCGSPPPTKAQPTSPGSGYGPYAGYSLW